MMARRGFRDELPMALTRGIRSVAVTLILGLGIQSLAYACTPRAPTDVMSPGPHDYSYAPATSTLWRKGDPGEPLVLHIRVLDTCSKPLAGARVQVLHADQDGDHYPDRWRAVLTSNERGELKLLTVFPGYAGDIPRHIHFIVSHPGHGELVTRLFFRNDPTADESIEDNTVVLDEIRQGKVNGWIGGYEFVLAPN